MRNVKQESCEHRYCKVIGLTRRGIKPESTASKADALTTRPSELFKLTLFQISDRIQAIDEHSVSAGDGQVQCADLNY